jgi:hypothetical protein
MVSSVERRDNLDETIYAGEALSTTRELLREVLRLIEDQ